VSVVWRCSRIATLALAAALPLAACGGGLFSKGAPATYDLTAARGPRAAGPVRGQLLVNEPTALAILETERIVVRPAEGQVAYLAGAQWSDRLPRLLQARLVQSFENASRLRAVGRPGERLTADYQLVTDIRAFNITATSPASAEVEIAVKLVVDRTGRILGARVFKVSIPARAAEGPDAVAALDTAFGEAAIEIVRWATGLV
jgi:cholesterol transport system auxiliary component